ncbi:hypothetical protein [uncultured Draconibacterium sp.]|mgnify:CR=1 FL=1|uniref:hypothetical protein n=1 Tax=uncultured Draconibacterium sp. TaxID=1573823 RepID=UPI0025E2C5C7|nr:hypothetical protein [uncultured Draconibacterium sp.]
MAVNKKSNAPKIIFILSMVVVVYWTVVTQLNLSGIKNFDVVFEILWLPMLAGLFGLLITTLVLTIIKKFNLRSLYLYSFLILLAAILWFTFG